MNEAFHEGSMETRYKSMGDEAESHFEANNTGFVRFGLQRPPFYVHKLPYTFRHTPDYLQVAPTRLVEVMGMGRTPLKLKLDKLTALQWWDGSEMDVWLWVWSSTLQNFAQLKFRDLMHLINTEEVPVGKFHEGKTYLSIREELLPWNET